PFRLRNGNATLPQAVEGSADLLPHAAVGGPGLERDEQRRRLARAEIRDGGDERRRVIPGETRREIGSGDASGRDRVRIDPETNERRGGVGPPIAHDAGVAAAGHSASRDSTWSWIQCASHHSTGSTCTPWIMMLKCR